MLVEIFAEIVDKFEQKNASTWLNIENEFRDGKKFKDIAKNTLHDIQQCFCPTLYEV